jgi:magnesium chelatase family protein
MLARRLTTLRPAMTLPEAIETTRIHRVSGLTGDRTPVFTTRPFCAPYHISTSDVTFPSYEPRCADVLTAVQG